MVSRGALPTLRIQEGRPSLPHYSGGGQSPAPFIYTPQILTPHSSGTFFFAEPPRGDTSKCRCTTFAPLPRNKSRCLDRFPLPLSAILVFVILPPRTTGDSVPLLPGIMPSFFFAFDTPFRKLSRKRRGFLHPAPLFSEGARRLFPFYINAFGVPPFPSSSRLRSDLFKEIGTARPPFLPGFLRDSKEDPPLAFLSRSGLFGLCAPPSINALHLNRLFFEVVVSLPFFCAARRLWRDPFPRLRLTGNPSPTSCKHSPSPSPDQRSPR